MHGTLGHAWCLAHCLQQLLHHHQQRGCQQALLVYDRTDVRSIGQTSSFTAIPKAVCPTKVTFVTPLQGVSNCVGAYDLITGCRTGRVEVGQPAVDMAFSPDGSMLVVATRVRQGCCRQQRL